ncbi:MAG: Calcium-transporting ATPase, partial [Nitrospirota bacterium]
MTSPPESVAESSWHALSTAAAVTALSSNLDAGLTAEEANRRQAKYGFNELPEAPPPSLLNLFFSQFANVIVWVLIGAAGVSGLLEDWLDAAAILTIVILNGLLGFFQEFRAERSLAALRKLSVAMARVLRGGTLAVIPARELVPGDLIVLEAGDRIPADARLIYATALSTQEASLTGESTPVQKDAQASVASGAIVAERTDMVFMGTVAVSGKARAVVVATGLHTEL